MQLLKFEIQGITIINVYRSSESNQESLCQKLKELLNESDPCLVVGDFNVCSRAQSSSIICKWFSANKFQQIVKESTHSRGRVIDHVYVRCIGQYKYCYIQNCSGDYKINCPNLSAVM